MGTDAGDQQQQHQHDRTPSGNFLSSVFGGLSPKSSEGSAPHHKRNMSIEEEKQDFHDKNQAFLQKAEKEKAKLPGPNWDLVPQNSLRSRPIRSSSPRPPTTRGSHRPGLASIDDDNWEEEEAAQRSMRDLKSGHDGREQHAAVRGGHRHAHAPFTYDRGRGGGGGGDDDNHGRDREASTADDWARRRRRGRELSKRGYGSTSAASRGHGNSSRASRESERYGRKGNSGGGRRKGRGRHEYESESSYSSESYSSDSLSDGSNLSVSSSFLGSDDSSEDSHDEVHEVPMHLRPTERTKLLSPAGISTHERQEGVIARTESGSRSSRSRGLAAPPDRDASRRRGQRSRREERVDYDRHRDYYRRHKSGRSKERRHRSQHADRSRQQYRDRHYTSDSSESSDYRGERGRSGRKPRSAFEREREKLMDEWKAEARAEIEAMRAEEETRKWHNRAKLWSAEKTANLATGTAKFFANLEAIISNMPSTIGAVAMAIVTLGVVWFKYAEENLDSCEPVHFHSSQCSFPEFPGCFYCDKSARMYRVAVNFHYVCSTVAGILVMVFFAKIALAWRVVLDELSSPTTSSPAGLICMTMVCVFAGRGWIGQALVTAAAAMHLCIVIWFLYMALAYRILPDPSWYPNTVGLGLSAVKTWLYYSTPGHFLMAISLILNIFFFPISVYRVTLNKKISAPVGWIQMSAPAVALYSLTIMAQPSFEEEHPDVTAFQRMHRMIYLPSMHFMFILSVIGAFSSAQSLYARWDSFSQKEFSPAHAAFCFPTLAHANAIQAYRGAIDSFSNIKPGSPFKILIDTYWLFVLLGGTIATIVITARFFKSVPSWTLVDVEEEEEPPAPRDTLLVAADGILAGDTMRQNYVSPAVLQANETGVLVALPRDHGHVRYVRTRKVTALGFDPIMSLLELDIERETLLEEVAKNPPRRRKRTLSVPGVDFNYGYGDFGIGNAGVFDAEVGQGSEWTRNRAQTGGTCVGSRRTNTDFV
uniref:Uncharacterized protein n=1 Tax=Odontella aurita TaxID=265563 RepID=A0A6U6DSM2_9STRA